MATKAELQAQLDDLHAVDAESMVLSKIVALIDEWNPQKAATRDTYLLSMVLHDRTDLTAIGRVLRNAADRFGVDLRRGKS